ncbi:ABC transporter permease [Paenactinomyces guangxiensis]|uniref:Sugar ABC transporter permease n=1 Tax=Paenactinomyces guangxiensis TaxID=1490290 RepID=A0A7W1WP39_9BACL|nr:ABC transporter permease subunit [Paenactinomyces guangxiensis]MBA4493478.1 sugar ABC transporter permease [Paenactinomyces guangxiensis]MBH8590569.1 sugar ABC transporter permease [Paenactinomyces guangxiensis]
MKTKKTLVFKTIKKDWQLYSLLVLPIIYLVVFKYIPMIGNMIAFRRFIPGGNIFGEEWVGLHYFKMFIEDPTFWQVFKNTLILSSLTLLFVFPAPIIIALLLNEVKSKKFKKFVQTTSYLPHFLSIVIISGMILQLTSTTGAINELIQFFGGEPIIFMQDPSWFRPVYIASEVWQTMGWGAILYLAALTNIDESLYEAAKIDGANRWKQTIHITIPGILPTIITLLILNIGNLLAVGFEKILLIYNPLNYETSDVISTYLYRVGLQSSNFSYATAIGLFEAVIGLILVFSANYLSKKFTDNGLW